MTAPNSQPILTRRRRERLALGAQAALLLLVALLLFGPVIVLAVFSFNDSQILAFPLKGFTSNWYSEALDNASLMDSLWASLRIAAIVTPICMVLGILSAFGLSRFRFRGKGGVTGFIALPLVMPWLLIGVGALVFFSRLDVDLSFWTIGVMHIVVTFPLVTALLSAQLSRMAPQLQEAAMDLGATPRVALRLVVLPLLYPSLAAAAIFAFSWSFNNFTVSFFTAGFDETFPIWIFSSLRRARNLPVINAISTLVSVVQISVVYLTWKVLRIRAERNGIDIRDVIAGGA